MANYAFYKNVIDCNYNFEGSSKPLHGVFSSIMNKHNITVVRILPIFQMFKYYERLSYAAGDRREELFNVKSQQEFLVGLGSNAGFVKSLTSYIDNGMRQLLLCQNNKDKQCKLKSIKDVIKMGTQFQEREMFILYYMKSLENRLFKVAADLDAEKEAVELFAVNHEDNRNVQRMYDMVTDIEACRNHKKFVEKIEVNISKETKEKYSKIGIEQVMNNRERITVLPLAYGVWDATLGESNGNLKVPLQLQLGLDVFNAYYLKRYPYRNVTYDFTQGNAVINIIFGGIKYNINVTTPQLFLLYQFNGNKELSATDLAKNTGMTLKELTPVLNSLIKCNLVGREEGNSNDPNLKFFLNKNFKSNQKE
jgi:hypothetical protein